MEIVTKEVPMSRRPKGRQPPARARRADLLELTQFTRDAAEKGEIVLAR